MKYLKYLFFLSLTCYSQNLKILSAKDSLPISDVWFVHHNIIISTSDMNGNISFDQNQFKTKDTITIHHLNYLDKKYTYDVITTFKSIYLEEKTFTIDEVSVEKRSEKRKIYPDKSTTNLFEIVKSQKPDYSSQIALYIPFKESYLDFSIKKIFVTPKIGYWDKDDSFKNLPFNVNLYTFDTLSKVPNDKIFMKNYFVKKGDNEEVEIILENKIDFPKEGIFIVVSLLSKAEYKKINSTQDSRPSFKVVAKKKKSAYQSFIRYYSTSEKEYSRWHNLEEFDIHQNHYFGLEIVN